MRFVHIGKVFEGGVTIHGNLLTDDLVRVVVEEAHDADALVPVPTDEIKYVGQALKTFSAWPRHLIKRVVHKVEGTPKKVKGPSKNKLEVDNDPVQTLYKLAILIKVEPLAIYMDDNIFGRQHQMIPLYIHSSNCVDILAGNKELTILVIHLWITYLNRLCVEMDNSDVYGFLDLQMMQHLGTYSAETNSYIMHAINDSNKWIYFAPYINGFHWQLIIFCPLDHIAVFFCSLHRNPSNMVKKSLEADHDGFHLLRG